jgi:hypothetical protein
MPEECDRGLRVVASKRRLAVSAELFRPENAQPSLFREEDTWMIVFINVSELRGDDFTNAIKYADPSVVLDLRLAPRFDIGSLNRERAFELFSSVKTRYVDATAPIMNGESREVAIQRIIRHIPIGSASSRGTVVFLLGRNDQSSIASQSEMLTLLGQSEKRLDVINIPELSVSCDPPTMQEDGRKLRSVG